MLTSSRCPGATTLANSPERPVAQWSPDAHDISPLDFLTLEQFLLLPGPLSQQLGF